MKLKTPLISIFASQKTESKTARWMVVDDSPQVLDSLGSLLESLERAEIYKFRSAEEALNCFSLCSDGFELVITDRDLPRMNGIELCRRMREISPLAKIVLSTARVLAPDEAQDAGFCAVLQKPYSATRLCELVKSALAQNEG